MRNRTFFLLLLGGAVWMCVDEWVGNTARPAMSPACVYCQTRNGSLSIDPCDKRIGKYVQNTLLLFNCHMGTSLIASE